MDLLEDLIMSLLNFNLHTYIWFTLFIKFQHGLKITWIILKIIFSNAFFKSIIYFYFDKKIIFFVTYNDGESKAGRSKHN